MNNGSQQGATEDSKIRTDHVIATTDKVLAATGHEIITIDDSTTMYLEGLSSYHNVNILSAQPE